MKITYNWLRQYVDFDWSPEELAERLTMLGLEVEHMHHVGGEFEGIVVAQVLSVEKHPNADKLTVCMVDDGQGVKQIVCGARNFKAGDKVVLIKPGYALPKPSPDGKPVVIKPSKIRGVESFGMLCSEEELGLAENSEGIMVLPPDAPIGTPFGEYLGRPKADVIYDLEITPNRPDLTGVIGIAREVGAVLGHPIKLPSVELPVGEGRIERFVAVEITAPALCRRYTARVVRGVKIGPSPTWLSSLLELLGFRSINNVVDVTNFVMMETGQPLHAFDMRLLAEDGEGRKKIIVRTALPNERFTTLDGIERELTERMLVIADPVKAVALAGIMGGANSEINPDTSDVLIESANFDPVNIRRTSRALGLRTESSYRFERGVDIEMADWASRRCARLILDTAGGVLVDGAIDEYPGKREKRLITLNYARTNAILGTPINSGTQREILLRLGFELISEDVDADRATFAVPTWRVDVKRDVDLIEEIERVYGVEKIKPSKPRGAIGTHPFDEVYDQIQEARRILCGLGLYEAQGQSLVSVKVASLVLPLECCVRVANPLSIEMSVLRPSLLPGLLDSVRFNLHRRNPSVALFEIGKVFARGGAELPVKEERMLGIVMVGDRWPVFWEGADRAAKFDVFDLKGVIEEFLISYGVKGVSYEKNANPSTLFYDSCLVLLGRHRLGEFGILSPQVARIYDFQEVVVLGELNLDLLMRLRSREKKFESLPQFPAIRRDMAIVVPENVTHEQVLKVINAHKPPILVLVEIFDVYRGRNIPEGHKSMAYAFTYRASDRTLTDQEVNRAHEELVRIVLMELGATLRA